MVIKSMMDELMIEHTGLRQIRVPPRINETRQGICMTTRLRSESLGATSVDSAGGDGTRF